MSNIAFIEDYSETYLKMWRDKYQFIALNPMAMYELDKANINYKIPEDYYIWEETENYKKRFMRFLLSLEKVLDSHFADKLVDIDLPITIHCISMLKNTIDAYVRTAIQFKRIIEHENPKVVWYLINDNRIGESIDDELYFKGQSLYFRLFKSYSFYEMGISSNFMPIFDKFESKKISNWRDNEALRFIYDFFRCLQFIPSWKKNKTILFANPISDKMRFAKLCGYKVDVLRDYYHRVDYDEIETDDLQLGALYELLDSDDMPNTIVTKRVLEYRIKYFIKFIVPRILYLSDLYTKHFRGKEYSCIVFNTRNKLYKYAALIAAKKVKLKTIYCRHGWDIYHHDYKQYTNFESYDYYVCSVEKDKKYFKRWIDSLGIECEVI